LHRSIVVPRCFRRAVGGTRAWHMGNGGIGIHSPCQRSQPSVGTTNPDASPQAIRQNCIRKK
jgi:hypothetical protein